MKQIIFGIFAHPDDAGFGPSGTLSMLARDGAEVHLICATCGDAGMNGTDCEDLGKRREQEEKTAAKVMGVTSLKLLRYGDGQLCNNLYLEIATKIIAHVKKLAQPDDQITLITFDTDGISGHIDHIVMSMVTTYVYLHLKDDLQVTLKYFCIPESFAPEVNTEWLYMPKGRSDAEIDEIIDVRSVRDQKIAAIKAHKTQAHDAERHLARGDALFDEHFMHYKD